MKSWSCWKAPAPPLREEMARQLGVSRNAVWKAVQRLREDGYQIEAATNRGLSAGFRGQRPHPQSVRRLLEGPAQSCAIEVRDSVTSTNTVLKSIAEQGQGRRGMALIAQQQTQGKAAWAGSFLLAQGHGAVPQRFAAAPLPPRRKRSITTAAAVAVAEAIDQLTGQQAKIKWVNDVYLRGRKVCGILTEAAVDFESSGLHYAILGIGINLRAPEGGFPPEIAGVAGALFHDEVPPGAPGPPGRRHLEPVLRLLQRFAPPGLHGSLPPAFPAHRAGGHLYPGQPVRRGPGP